MKKLFLILIIAFAALTSCKDDKKEGGKLNPNAKLMLNGVSSQKSSVSTKGILGTELTDSVDFIVRYAWWFNTPTIMAGFNFGFGKEFYSEVRDFENKRLIFSGEVAINRDGEVGTFVTDFEDIVLVTGLDKDGNAISPYDWPEKIHFTEPLDTIAYIPNAVVRTARAAIVAAFAAEDYEACYALFHNAYVFRPTTGAKWRAMKAAGIE